MEVQRSTKRQRLFAEHRSLIGLLLIFLALATLYNLSLPLYEAPDEADHFRYVNWLAAGRGLPDLEQDLVAAGHEIGPIRGYLGPFHGDGRRARKTGLG